MMRHILRSILDDLLSVPHGAFVGITEEEATALGQRLQILQTAPEPELAAGRQRVIAEAARLQERHQGMRKLVPGTQPRFSFAFALVAFLLLVGPFAAIALAWNSAHSGSSIFGFFSTPTLAFTPMPATHTSEAIVNELTPISNPTPSRRGMKVTAVPIRMLAPTIIPEPTPVPMLTLTVPAQAQPTY